MIERTRCQSCKQRYELIWDDQGLQDEYIDDDDNFYEDHDAMIEEDAEGDPVYCPFCGTHCDFDE